MKVLHIIGGGDVGGAKAHVISLTRELSKYIDVKIISLRPGSFTNDARSAGVNIDVVKTGNIITDIREIVNIIRDGGFDIIHSHGAKANMYSLLAKRTVLLPSVTTVHSDYRLDYMHSALKMLSFGVINTIALRFIDYHIGVTDNYREMLIRRRFNPENIFTLRNSMDFSKPLKEYPRAAFLRKYGLEIGENDVVVGILGRLHPIKGQDTFINAANIVLKHNPSVKFLIGGEGDYRKALERKISNFGISENVLMPGWIDDPYEFMANIDINVLSSISEGFPYVILEGAMLKKATISSDVGGISDLIENAVNGYLFNPGDYRKLAACILELSVDTELRQKIGEEIYRKASSHFSLQNMCSTQLNIYKKILENEKAGNRGKSGYDVIISGYYGFRNIGDDAMLMAIINNLRIYRNIVRMLVLSSNPIETKRICNVDSIGRYNIFRIISAMRKTKLFIYGGGTLIQDSTSTRSLFYYLGIIWMAKKIGLRVMLYANGIEPMSKHVNRILTQRIVNRVDVITLREEASKAELKKLCINKPTIIVTADPALTIDPAPGNEIDKILIDENIGTSGPFIGFSARKWEGYRQYEGVIARVADYMAEKYGAKPVFVSMQYPDDILVIKSIVSKMKYTGYIIKNKYSASHVLGIIGKMEMLIGMRLHALVFAASRGIPVVGLSYQPKVEWFLQYIKQSGASAGSVTKLKSDRVIELAEKIWTNRSEIRNQLQNIIDRLKEKALENAKIAVDLIDESYKKDGK